MNVEKIVINYSGWISVAKEDLKVVEIDPKSGNMVDVDTSEMTVDDITTKLSNGELFLKSFGNTYENDTIDGEDLFEYDVEEDED